MTGNEFQQSALRTWNDIDSIHPYGNLLVGALGLSGETGEVTDHVKKWYGQGHDLDRNHLAEELGDICYYVAVTAEAIGWKLDDILEYNKKKLEKRYPDGFDTQRSLHREV